MQHPNDPSGQSGVAAPDSQREAVIADRKAHIGHEASVRSIGTLYLLNFLMVPVWIAIVAFAGPGHEEPASLLWQLPVVLLLGALGMFYGVMGVHLRRLNPKARIPTAIMSGFGLLGFPLGTLISLYILWLLLGEKGKYVMSPQYARVRRATPEIRYRTSWVVWLVLASLAVALVTALGVAAT